MLSKIIATTIIAASLHPKSKNLSPEQQISNIWQQKKGRGGKTVTVIMNLQLTPADMKALSKQPKQVCGVGG
jgi:translation initiation factor 1 (eIF-1/SUI1)